MDSLLATVRKHSGDVLLFLAAFDGVLAEYGEDPHVVSLGGRQRAMLRRLQESPGVIVGVTSGRRLDDLRKRVDIGDEAFYVGLHGIEAVGPGFSHVHDTAFGHGDALRQVADRLRGVVSGIAGVRVEFKGAVIALHTRAARSQDAVWSRIQLLAAAADLVNAGTARIIRGHHVLELIADVGHPKAQAIAAIQRTVRERYRRPVYTVYVGEDVADDDGFDAMCRRGIGVAVGKRQGHADYHLCAVAEVEQLVSEISSQRCHDRV